MTNAPQPAHFDAQPPIPVNEYEQTVKRVSVGYDLVFTLTTCFLRSLRQPGLNLLVVGAGGGMEIEWFLPGNPGWRITGVDPSADMLALAQAKADHLGVSERVTLVRGTVDDLPTDDNSRFDAATCMFVLHFLPDAAKLSLLQGVTRRLLPSVPLILVSGTRGDTAGADEDLRGIWQQYGEMMGMPAERMAKTIERLLAESSAAAPAERYEHLLHEAGFQRVTRFFSALQSTGGWIAR